MKKFAYSRLYLVPIGRHQGNTIFVANDRGKMQRNRLENFVHLFLSERL